ncbi:hypothetical protein DPMN_131939 [Dreissena polymorpha]|uniref:Uncharacterized protein n=1 Tax=Dreissena polymorpha TaxID=45954 RepID=A0A9D4JCP7_DREPO|nr:hypothetical protein DPMN_131939 [Dreissena polymorpha]
MYYSYLFLHGGVQVCLQDSLGILKLGLHDAHLYLHTLLKQDTGITHEQQQQ